MQVIPLQSDLENKIYWFKYGKVTFKDKQNSWYSEPFGYYMLSNRLYSFYIFDTLEEIVDFCYKTTNITLNKELSSTDKNIIFENSSFPSLLLSRLKENYPEIPFKRVLKKSTANKIITDSPYTDWTQMFNFGIRIMAIESNSKNAYDFNYYVSSDNFGFNYTSNSFINLTSTDLYNIKNIISNLQAKYPNAKIAYGIMSYISKKDTIEKYLDISNNSDKYISTEIFTRQLWEYMPPISDTEFDTVRKYLKALDFKTNNIGFQTLQYFNFKNNIVEIAKYMYNLSGNNTIISFIKYLVRWRVIKNRYNFTPLHMKLIQNSNLFTEEERKNFINVQRKYFIKEIINLNKDILISLNVHVGYKEFDGTVTTVE